MNDFTAAEQDIIDAQGWNADSLVAILSGWDPVKETRIERLRAVAAEENDYVSEWEV